MVLPRDERIAKVQRIKDKVTAFKEKKSIAGQVDAAAIEVEEGEEVEEPGAQE